MDQPMGGKIALRQLGPLPDLDSVVFVRKLNRAFVTGSGPLGPPSPRPARRFLRVGMWLMLAVGILASLLVGAAEYFERQQWKELQTTLRTVDAEVIGCDAATLVLPQLRYTAEGTTYQHYPRYAPADICDKKPRQVTYVAGHPDSWALAPARETVNTAAVVPLLPSVTVTSLTLRTGTPSSLTIVPTPFSASAAIRPPCHRRV
jgi:hypothetical protein